MILEFKQYFIECICSICVVHLCLCFQSHGSPDLSSIRLLSLTQLNNVYLYTSK